MSTIYALSSAEGRAGIAVFRVSGPEAYSLLCHLTGGTEFKPRQAYLRKLSYNQELIDTALVIYFKAPHSFTGEECVEFHLHGSPAIIKKFPLILSELQCRQAEPGEFTKRAFYNHQLDLTEVEGLSHLIQAETEAQHRVAIKQMQGETRSLFAKWRDHLISMLAFVEADIDFVEGEIPDSVTDQVRFQLSQVIDQIEAFISLNERVKHVQHGLKVALVGAPNVGKSSFYNAMLRRDAALVSPLAGTTRDILETHLNLAGFPIILADMAGLRESPDSLEQQGIDKAKAWQNQADLRILFLSHDQDIPDETTELIQNADLILLTKSDLGEMHKLSGDHVLSVSLLDDKDISTCLDRLIDLVKAKQPDSSANFYMETYHREQLEAMRDELRQASKTKEIELMAEQFRTCLHHLGKLTGHIDVEDILGKIFSTFCIGK